MPSRLKKEKVVFKDGSILLSDLKRLGNAWFDNVDDSIEFAQFFECVTAYVKGGRTSINGESFQKPQILIPTDGSKNGLPITCPVENSCIARLPSDTCAEKVMCIHCARNANHCDASVCKQFVRDEYVKQAD